MAVAKKITINDVALAAGVSVSTVSLVLSGKGRISPATGQRVNEAVEQLGFVRNRQASALRGGQSGVIGLIVRDLTAGASGVGSELCERAAQKGVPLVFASRASYLDEADTLRPDNMQAAQMLTEHLIHRGHQRIAWLGGKSSSLTRAERVGGYCSTLIKYGLPFHSEWVMECESSQKKAAEAIGTLLRTSPTISAVICYNDVIAMGAWFGLIRAGRQSGEGGVETFFGHQVALGAFADVGENALDDLPIVWATTPAREMGYTLADRIMQRIEKADVQAGHQIVAARLVTVK